MVMVEPPVELPEWDYPQDLGRVTNQIEYAINGAGGILGSVLAPVRQFVRWVLEPLFSLADDTGNFAYHVTHNLWDRVRVAIWDAGAVAIFAVRVTWDALSKDITSLRLVTNNNLDNIARYIGDVVRPVEARLNARIDDAVHYASRVADGARQLVVESEVETRHLAKSWVDDAVRYTTQVEQRALSAADNARRSAVETAVELLNGTARVLRVGIDDAVHHADMLAETAASDLASAARHIEADVVAPIGRRLDDFLSGPWRWAVDILQVVEGALDWIVWVTIHAVPEVVAIYRFVRDLGSDRAEDLFQVGAGIAGSARR